MGTNPFLDTGNLTWYIILGCLVLGITNVLIAWRARRKVHVLPSNDSVLVRQSLFDWAFFLNAFILMGFWLGYLFASSAIATPPFLPVSHGIFAGALILLYWILAAFTRVQLPSRKGIYYFLFATIASLFIAIGLAYFLLSLLSAEVLAAIFGPTNDLSPYTVMIIYINFLFAFPSNYFLFLFVLYTASLFVAIVTFLLLRFLVKSGALLYTSIRKKSLNNVP